MQSDRKSSQWSKDYGQCLLTQSKVSQRLLKLMIDVTEFTLMF